MNLPGATAPRRREAALSGLFYLAATVGMTWPQAARLCDGMTDLWDAKLTAWILQWDFSQTLRAPLELFQAPFFHPARYVLAFSENLFGVALFGFPVLASGGSALLNYNVLLLTGMFLSAWSAWALARYVTGDALASLAAGLVFAFLPWRLSQLPHIQFQWGAFLCLLLLFLVRYLDSGRRRDAVLFGVFFAWNALSNVHYALFSGFLVAAALLTFAAQGSPELRRRLVGALLAAALGALVFLPFALSYRKAAELYGMERHYGEVSTYSGRWSDFLSAGAANRTYGEATKRWVRPEGDFFPGLAAAALAAVALARVRRRASFEPAGPVSSPARRRAARALDMACLAAATLWLAALLMPDLRIGPLSVGDPGRVLVLLTALGLARLTVAFPRWARYSSLPDFLRRSTIEPRIALFCVIAVSGILVALGTNTPYYRFLFQSFGAVFRAIRAPSRGIVLFDLALGVLAAWGLSFLTRGRSWGWRISLTAGAILAIVFEYRGFPLKIHAYDPTPAPVYRWIAGLDLPGAVVEWPLGPRDVEFLYRQASHGKPLVNGYSGFFPKGYREIEGRMRLHPIPNSVWGALENARASLVVFHPDDSGPLEKLECLRLIRRGIAEGRLEPIGSFPHGVDRDVALRLKSGPVFNTGLPAEAAEQALRLLERSEADAARPLGVLEVPVEGQRVEPGFWGYGWALDDSGISEVRVTAPPSTASGHAQVGRKWPGLAEAYPDYVAPGNGGYGFLVPDLPPGPQTLRITLVGRDGGETVISRRIVIGP